MRAGALALLLLASCSGPLLMGPTEPGRAQPRASSVQQTLVIEAAAGATSYEVEESKDNGSTWRVIATIAPASCSATECTATVTAGQGRTLYRWATIVGTTRSLRTDAGVYACLGLPDCPFARDGVGVK